MRKIPESVILKFIKENFEYKSTLSDEKEIIIKSPFVANKKGYKCYINLEKNVFIDYYSGLSGSFLTFVKEYLELSSNYEAEKILFEEYFQDTSIEECFEKNVKEIKKEKSEITLPNYSNFDEVSYIGKRALKYLNNRRFDLEKIKKYNLGYCFDGEYENRIIIPFYENNEIVYFLARSFSDSKLRYKNPPNLNSKDFVFNIDNIEDTIIIVEGVFDAMTIDNFPATATLSTDISNIQCKKIFNKKIKNVIFAPQNDLASYRNLERNFKKMKSNQPLFSEVNYYVYELDNSFKDLNEANINEIKIEKCKKVSNGYFLDLYDKIYPFLQKKENMRIVV
jgi:DNA primase